MRLTTILFSILTATTLSLAACGGGSGSDDTGGDDAPPDANDTAVVPDAMEAAGLTGLGQSCVVAMQSADCPATASGCLYTQGATTGICTKECVASSSFMTNGATPPVPGAFTPDPTTQNGMCTAIFTGTTGTAVCSTPVNLSPAHNPLMPNTTYTVKFVCGIQCGAGNTCPGNLTCDTATMSCEP